MNKRICLNKSVLDFMSNILKQCSESLVLEFGSGWSSAWFAERCHGLVTVETNPKWAQRVKEDLLESGFNQWEMVESSPHPRQFSTTVIECMQDYGLDGAYADIVLVDCREDLRMVASRLAWHYLKPGGWIVFDDAHVLTIRMRYCG